MREDDDRKFLALAPVAQLSWTRGPNQCPVLIGRRDARCLRRSFGEPRSDDVSAPRSVVERIAMICVNAQRWKTRRSCARVVSGSFLRLPTSTRSNTSTRRSTSTRSSRPISCRNPLLLGNYPESERETREHQKKNHAASDPHAMTQLACTPGGHLARSLLGTGGGSA